MTKYIINPLNSNTHKKDIIDLWKGYLKKYFDGRYEWLYKWNPHGETRTVLAFSERQDDIAGCCSIIPRPLFLKGKIIPAGIAVDFIVHENHRTFGPAIKLQRANFSDDNIADFEIVLAFPNKAAKGPIIRVGCKQLGSSSLFTKILKTENKLVKYIKIQFLRKAIGAIFDVVLNIADHLKVFSRSSKWDTEVLSDFDNRFDAFWSKVQGNLIIADRRAQCLNWRYTRNRNDTFKVFSLCDKNSKVLKGYIVYFIKEKVANIEDMFAANEEDEWFDLIYEFSLQMRNQRVEAICVTYFGNKFLHRIFKRLYFFEKKDFRNVFIYLNKNVSASDRETALNPDNWCLFDGDLDL